MVLTVFPPLLINHKSTSNNFECLKVLFTNLELLNYLSRPLKGSKTVRLPQTYNKYNHLKKQNGKTCTPKKN